MVYRADGSFLKSAMAHDRKTKVSAGRNAIIMSGGPNGRGFFLLVAGVSSARQRTHMQGSLGEKISEGAFSEAYAWARVRSSNCLNPAFRGGCPGTRCA